MLDSYRTIKEDGQWEIDIKKSRFICFLQRVTTEEEARTMIQEIKKQHWKANHNCSAFIIGSDGHLIRSSDDGEPSGTAGTPMLEVLKQNEIINVVAVVTRYFGGTKLGAGGLIRAYSTAVSEALKQVGIVEIKTQQELFVTIEYSLLGKLQHFLELNDYSIKDTQFTNEVTVCLTVDEVERTQAEIVELLNNQVTFKIGQFIPTEIPIT
ncbi:MAG: YigZ family protein [Enterococcus aquimarinus]